MAPQSQTDPKTKRSSSLFARRLISVGIIVSTAMVALSVYSIIVFDPEKTATRTLETMGREYYESYYYDRFMETISQDVFAEKMAVFSETGFHPVPLRQLLLYQNEKNAKYRNVFDTDDFSCDKNNTTVKIIPKEPFSKTDYEIELNLSCAKG